MVVGSALRAVGIADPDFHHPDLAVAHLRDDRHMTGTVATDDISAAEDHVEVVRRELLLLDPMVRADIAGVRGLLDPSRAELR